MILPPTFGVRLVGRVFFFFQDRPSPFSTSSRYKSTGSRKDCIIPRRFSSVKRCFSIIGTPDTRTSYISLIAVSPVLTTTLRLIYLFGKQTTGYFYQDSHPFRIRSTLSWSQSVLIARRANTCQHQQQPIVYDLAR